MLDNVPAFVEKYIDYIVESGGNFENSGIYYNFLFSNNKGVQVSSNETGDDDSVVTWDICIFDPDYENGVDVYIADFEKMLFKIPEEFVTDIMDLVANLDAWQL